MFSCLVQEEFKVQCRRLSKDEETRELLKRVQQLQVTAIREEAREEEVNDSSCGLVDTYEPFA